MVQVFSRFALPYLVWSPFPFLLTFPLPNWFTQSRVLQLNRSGTLKSSVVEVASPGGGIKHFDADDLELKKAYEQKKHGILAMAKRDSAVLDAITAVSPLSLSLILCQLSSTPSKMMIIDCGFLGRKLEALAHRLLPRLPRICPHYEPGEPRLPLSAPSAHGFPRARPEPSRRLHSPDIRRYSRLPCG
jgi:hypothetical protein